jgi:hypothetical protein
MKFTAAKGFVVASVAAVAVSLMVVLNCGDSNPTQPPDPVTSATLESFVLQSQGVPGWQRIMSSWDNNDTLFYFVQTNLMELCDGGNESYCGVCDGHASPLVDGIHYRMYDSISDSDRKTFGVFVFNYGSVKNATDEFTKRKAAFLSNGAQVTIPSFDPTVACGAEVSGGMKLAAHFNKFYFEMEFKGYNSGTDAAGDASTFLQLFKSKI